VKTWLRKGCFASVAALGLVALVLGGTLVIRHLSEDAEDHRLVQSPAGSRPGTVVLSLSSAAVTVAAGPAGEPIRVESSFDPDLYRLEHEYEEDGAGGWTYRVEFHEKTLLHVSVVGIWFGRRSPEVRVVLPKDLPLALEARMRGGYLSLDLAGLVLTDANVELDRGVLELAASEPLPVPVDQLTVRARMGTMMLTSLGNASPRKLSVRHGIGAALVDLSGNWLADADIDFQVTFGTGELWLPHDVNIEGLESHVPGRAATPDTEIPPPTLRISTHFDMGDIRVID